MNRGRFVTGVAAGIWLLLSAAAHSLLGWKALAVELAKAGVPAELERSLAIGWHFGGVAMLAFGCIVLTGLASARRGRAGALAAPRVVGWTCLAFGLGAMAVTGGNLFFLVFILPGALLAVATAGAPPRTYS